MLRRDFLRQLFDHGIKTTSKALRRNQKSPPVTMILKRPENTSAFQSLVILCVNCVETLLQKTGKLKVRPKEETIDMAMPEIDTAAVPGEFNGIVRRMGPYTGRNWECVRGYIRIENHCIIQ